MSTPVPATNTRKTPDFDFIFGQYVNARGSVPYFSIAMSFEDAAQYLRLVNEMPGASKMEWRIEELFQRDINWKRVDRSIVPYIKQESGPTFFNSLTIALLPIDGNIVGDFDSGESNAPKLSNEQSMQKILRIGPVSCGYWSAWDSISDSGAKIGQISWDYRKVAAVAIDGQHRLAAIKAAHKSRTESSVPVILVLLSKELGYDSDRPLLPTLRQLFIDLNKHAKTVNRARQILLDDIEVASVCVRSLVGSQLSAGTSELNEEFPRLPLSLVDWHSEQARFDEGPYVTTILGLDFAVSTLLQLKIRESTDYGKIRSELKNIKSYLNLDLPAAHNRLLEAKEYQRSFSYDDSPEGEIDQIKTAFMRRWNRPIVTLLTSFRPYTDLIRTRTETSSLTPEFENWYSLDKQTSNSATKSRPNALKQELLDELLNREQNPISETELKDQLDSAMKPKQDWPLAFNVVFQRALFIALHKLTRAKSLLPEVDEDEDDDDDDVLHDIDDASDAPDEIDSSDSDNLKKAQLLADALNTVIGVQYTFLTLDHIMFSDDQQKKDYFWIGSILDPSTRTIDFTMSASLRAADLLLVSAYLFLYKTMFPDAQFEQFTEELETSDQSVLKQARAAINRLENGAKNNRSIAHRILDAREQNPDDNVLRQAVIRARIGWLWQNI